MEDFFLKIEFSSPMDEDVRNYPNLPLYVVTKCNCAFPHNARPDSGLYGRTCLEMVTQFESKELLRLAWTAREPEAWCELGYRFLTCCNVPVPSRDLYGALHMFDALIDRDLARERYVGDRASRELRARAHSGAAEAYLRIWQTPVSDRENLETWRVGHERPWPDYEVIGHDAALIYAAKHAARSVRLGLVSRTALKVWSLFRDTFGENETPAVRPLLDAVRGVDEAAIEERRKREAKLANDPKTYVCAADGCKIEGVRKGGLMACGGTCSPDLKPHYCSKECQKRDWPRHKVVCKARTSGAAPPTSAGEQSVAERLRTLTLGSGRDGEVGGQWMGGIERKQGPGRMIEIRDYPGETIQLFSDTLLPTELRKAREMFRTLREAQGWEDEDGSSEDDEESHEEEDSSDGDEASGGGAEESDEVESQS